jgi:sugar/nucleoside kinase (ribokinase family)
MESSRKKVISYLTDCKATLSSKEVTIGLDAFIDKIVRVVQDTTENGENIYFSHIAHLGNHLISKSGMSCGIEICERFTKLGGNAPIMAHAIGSLDVSVNCIGALGYPEIDPIFKNLSSNCNLLTIGNPGFTTALEFDDGKIMLSQRDYLHKINWNTLKEMLGLSKIKTLFNNSNLIGLVNWNGMINFNDIFKGIQEEILVAHKPNKEQILFFDLADFSARAKEDISEAIKCINEFSKHYKVILGLNENECKLLYNSLYPEENFENLMEIGQYLYENNTFDALVVHTLTRAIAWNKDCIYEAPSLFVNKPKLSTGGGDNFNAGLCFGQLIGLDFEGSLYTANATSGYYVRNAKSPTVDNLIDTLIQWDDLIECPNP